MVVYNVTCHLTQALTDTMYIAYGAVVIHGELSNKRFLLFLSGKVKIYFQLFSLIYFSYNFGSFKFSLYAFTEFQVKSKTKIFVIKRARTCHLFREKDGTTTPTRHV